MTIIKAMPFQKFLSMLLKMLKELFLQKLMLQTYWEVCQTCKMEISNSILDFWQGFEYGSDDAQLYMVSHHSLMDSFWINRKKLNKSIFKHFQSSCSTSFSQSSERAMPFQNARFFYCYDQGNMSLVKLSFKLRWLAWLKQNCFFMDWFHYNLIILIK